MKYRCVHCSYHKCLTVYFYRVLSGFFNNPLLKIPNGYQHFNSVLDDFYTNYRNFRVASVNNHSLNFDLLDDDIRITRFIRDPRDLVVSGYFYHKKGSEFWCNIQDPKESDWKVVNGCMPDGMRRNHSFSSYLQGVNKEDGLIAEIDFRANHFESMRQWSLSDPRIKLFRYEDILGNERRVFATIFAHYGFSIPKRYLGIFFANLYSAKKQRGALDHIRNPRAGQWKEHFSDRVAEYFEQKYGDVLSLYGYG